MLIGIVIMVVAIPLSRLVRNAPEPYGMHPDGRASANVATWGETIAADANEPSFTWQEAIRTKTFWFIVLGHAGSSVIPTTMMVHLGPMLDDRDISLQTIGWVVATYTAVAAVFTLVGGYIGDHLPIRFALFWFAALQSVAVSVLLVTESLAMVYVFALVMGIGFGGRNPLTTAIRGAYFGRKAFASLTGISMIPMNVLLLGAPLFAGIMFDATGSYTIPFATVAILSLAGSSLFLLLSDPSSAPSQRGKPTADVPAKIAA